MFSQSLFSAKHNRPFIHHTYLTLKIYHVKTIIGVDRIDYSKGLLERFNAFATFLETNPEYHGLVRHLQVATPSRTDIPAYQRLYQRFKAKLELINEEFAHEDWRPIDCCFDTVQHDSLMHIYRRSDICWISSLRDGMNLVAKNILRLKIQRTQVC